MRTVVPGLVLVLLLAACGDTPAPTAAWSPIEPVAMSEDQKAQQAKGLAAKGALFSRLFAKLQEASAGGPAEALGACRISAPEIAAAVTDEHGLRIGRTSYKLRNPQNVPPAWAKSFVDARMDKPLWLAHEDGRLAGLLPIMTMPLCVTCHGSADSLADPIRKGLGEHYPDDQATGFSPGELRGWFWLEVPQP